MMSLRLAAVCILTVAIPASAWSQTPSQDVEAFEVVRLGDGQMTCEALVAEINSLNGQITGMTNKMTEASTEMTRSAMQSARGMGGGGMSTAMTLGSMAASFIPGAGLALGAAQAVAGAAQQAQMAAQRNQMVDQMEDMTVEMSGAMAMMGPISQRVEHLGEISRGKGC